SGSRARADGRRGRGAVRTGRDPPPPAGRARPRRRSRAHRRPPRRIALHQLAWCRPRTCVVWGGRAARNDAGSDDLQALDDGDVGLAAAFAHGLEAVTPAGALELVEQRGHEAGTSGAERVTEGDGAAVHVDLAEVEPGFLLPREHDRGERLVDLDEVDVV